MRDEWMTTVALLATEVATEGLVVRKMQDAADLLRRSPDDMLDLVDDGRLTPVLKKGIQRRNYRFTSRDLLSCLLIEVVESPRIHALERQLADALDEVDRVKRVRPSGRVLPTMRRAVIARDGRCCRYCRKPIGARSMLTMDHVLPVCRGGGDSLENLVVACLPCNRRKGTKLLEESGMTLHPVPVRGANVGRGESTSGALVSQMS